MTFKEFMHTPNPYLDKLAWEAEIQRTIDDEAAYDARCMEIREQGFCVADIVDVYDVADAD